MIVKINTTSELGTIAKIARKEQGMSQGLFAATAGLGERFVREVEGGKNTAQVGRVLSQLSELGVFVWLDVPSSVKNEVLINTLRREFGDKLIIKDTDLLELGESGGANQPLGE